MRFLVDESSDARLAHYLSSLGHDATTVAADYTSALADSEVLAIAHREERVLIANDRHFGELVFRLGRPHAGVILFVTVDEAEHRTMVLTFDVEEISAQLSDHFLVVRDR